MKSLRLTITFILLLFAAHKTAAQATSAEMSLPMVIDKLSMYIESVAAIEDKVGEADNKELDLLEASLESVNFRIESFFSVEQLQIMNNESAMDMMATYKVMYKSATDSIAHGREHIAAVDDFAKAETSVANAKPVFTKFHDDAMKYSLVKQRAPELEKLKAIEQQEFITLKEKYQKAKDAAAKYPELSARMKQLDENMLEIQLLSDKIWKMEYVPFIQRIKDYVVSIAAVAIIIMLISSIKSRISAAKAMKENAKKLQQQLENEDYPTI